MAAPGKDFPKGSNKRGRTSSKESLDAQQSVEAKRPRKQERKQARHSKSTHADPPSDRNKASDRKDGHKKLLGSLRTYLQGHIRWQDFEVISGSTLSLVREPSPDNRDAIAVYSPSEERVGYLDAQFGTKLAFYMDKGWITLRAKVDDPRPGFRSSPQAGLYVDILADPKLHGRILDDFKEGCGERVG